VVLFDFSTATQSLRVLWIATAALLYFVKRTRQFFITVSVIKSKARRRDLFADSTRPTDIIMLGDSITHEGLWQEYFPSRNIRNRGIGGDTTRDIRNRLDAIYPLRPQQLFLPIGGNDLNMAQTRAHPDRAKTCRRRG